MFIGNLLFTAFAFVVMISSVVIVHELGHYLMARAFGLIGSRFSIGFGPTLAAFTDKRGTEWRIAPILIGGYVSFPPEPDDRSASGSRTLDSLPRWQRFLVVAAGPGINLVMAVALFSSLAAAYGHRAGDPIIKTVEAGSPADAANLRAGDTILSINGRQTQTAADIS